MPDENKFVEFIRRIFSSFGISSVGDAAVWIIGALVAYFAVHKACSLIMNTPR